MENPEQTRIFVELVVEYPDPELCTYKECRGKPYYSIKYIENGERYVGFGTYKPEVLSQYLKEYFISSVQPEQRWIPCSERLPECEQEVLICTMKKVYVSRKSGMEWYEEPIITPALYEDGTMLEINSKWRWEDIDYAGWDEEEDCGIIPEGWWENRHFNQDDVYNNVVDKKVIAWMPLPEQYREEEDMKANK